ncbi:unnamed protein product [Caenorhabditis sp. 36 PRJEB53466]|nr:unnamed protein product [Caenorhabditis sp. 36 PRJEB53466]
MLCLPAQTLARPASKTPSCLQKTPPSTHPDAPIIKTKRKRKPPKKIFNRQIAQPNFIFFKFFVPFFFNLVKNPVEQHHDYKNLLPG